jgi:hypothetical protein
MVKTGVEGISGEAGLVRLLSNPMIEWEPLRRKSTSSLIQASPALFYREMFLPKTQAGSSVFGNSFLF